MTVYVVMKTKFYDMQTEQTFIYGIYHTEEKAREAILETDDHKPGTGKPFSAYDIEKHEVIS